MKNQKISCILSLIIGLTMLSCTTQQPVDQKEKYSLVGIWKLVSGEWAMQDTIYTFPSAEFKGSKSYKYLGKTHWANIGQDTAMNMFWAHAGIYRVSEDTYVEYFEMHDNIKRIGDSAVFKYTLDGDIWNISSDWLKEEWTRIE